MCSVSLTSFGTLKYDCEIKAVEIFSFLPLINNSVTTGLSFLLLIISERISSKTRWVKTVYTIKVSVVNRCYSSK